MADTRGEWLIGGRQFGSVRAGPDAVPKCPRSAAIGLLTVMLLGASAPFAQVLATESLPLLGMNVAFWNESIG